MINGQLNPIQGAMVETLDKYTGILLDSLDRMGLTDNTIVIVFSDNGQHAPGQELGVSPLRGYKCSFWEGGFREPLLVRWKGKIVAGSLCDKQVISMDFLPTIAELCGINAPELNQLDGKSFAKNLTINPELPIDRPYLCWHYPHYHPDAQFLGAIRKGDWKLIENFDQSLYFKSGGFELYNLKDDPKEASNLIDINPAKAAELYADLQSWRTETNAHMPGTKNRAYGMAHFQLHKSNTPVKTENFEIQSGLNSWLQYDGPGTSILINNNNELTYYLDIEQAGNYQFKFLYKNAASSMVISSKAFTNQTVNFPSSTNWNTISSANIPLNVGILKITFKITGAAINLDKFSLTNNNLTLIHDGEKPETGLQLKYGFEDNETSVFTSIEGSADNQGTLPVIVANPDKAGLNSTQKCLYTRTKKDLTMNPKVPAWNTNIITFSFPDSLMLTDDNRYFHLLHRKGQVLNTWLVYASQDGTNFTEMTRGTCPAATTWFDIIADVKSKFTSVKKLRIHLDGNWSGTDNVRYFDPTDFYYDEIAFTNSSLPRQKITSSNLEIKNETFRYYPNPVTNYFTVESGIPISKIRFINLTGVVMMQQYVRNNTFSVNTENMPKGFYFVETEFENGQIETNKIIKQ